MPFDKKWVCSKIKRCFFLIPSIAGFTLSLCPTGPSPWTPTSSSWWTPASRSTCGGARPARTSWSPRPGSCQRKSTRTRGKAMQSFKFSDRATRPWSSGRPWRTLTWPGLVTNSILFCQPLRRSWIFMKKFVQYKHTIKVCVSLINGVLGPVRKAQHIWRFPSFRSSGSNVRVEVEGHWRALGQFKKSHRSRQESCLKERKRATSYPLRALCFAL